MVVFKPAAAPDSLYWHSCPPTHTHTTSSASLPFPPPAPAPSSNMSSNGPSPLPPRPFCTRRTAGSRARHSCASGTGVITTPAQTPAPPGLRPFDALLVVVVVVRDMLIRESSVLLPNGSAVVVDNCQRLDEGRGYLFPWHLKIDRFLCVTTTTLPTTQTYTCYAGTSTCQNSKIRELLWLCVFTIMVHVVLI